MTWNVKHFPNEFLSPFGMAAITPDDFILDQLYLSPNLVLEAICRQKESLKNPAYTWREFLGKLENQGLSRSVAQIRKLLDESPIGVEQ